MNPSIVNHLNKLVQSVDACTFPGIGYEVYFYVHGYRFLRSYFVPFTTLVAGMRSRNFTLFTHCHSLRGSIMLSRVSSSVSDVASCQKVKGSTAKIVIRAVVD